MTPAFLGLRSLISAGLDQRQGEHQVRRQQRAIGLAWKGQSPGGHERRSQDDQMEVQIVPRPMPELQQEGAEADQHEQRKAIPGEEDQIFKLMEVDPQVVEQSER